MLVAAPPMFVSVMFCISDSPTRIVGSTAGLGAIASAESMPAHARPMLIVGVVGSLLWMVRLPFSPPSEVGLHVTVNPSLPPAPRPWLPVLPLTAKPPLALTLLIEEVWPPLFETVTPTPVDAVLIRTPPKLIEPGPALTWIGGGRPVPDSV